jgi:hypothetical protein
MMAPKEAHQMVKLHDRLSGDGPPTKTPLCHAYGKFPTLEVASK